MWVQKLPAWLQVVVDGVLWNINQMNVLNNFQAAKDGPDEKHICPLQLDLIEYFIELNSKPGDTILSPFAGIGSEGYQALRQGRRFVGVELKRSYWQHACRNLERAVIESSQLSLEDLFGGLEREERQVAA